MPRQIAYDPLEVRQCIMALFWEHGYAETSLTDLENATGLNRRQLYNGIGDKRAMFLQALDDFTDASGRSLLAPLESETAGLNDIKTLFDTFVGMSKNPGGSNGCLVCSSSQEDISSDRDVAARHAKFFARIHAAHRNALTKAAKRGEVDLSPLEIEARADALYTAHVALCVLARAGRPSDELQRMANQALRDIA